MLDLRKKNHNTLCEIANHCFKVSIEIGAYGSRVNGDNHESSDLDLVIRTTDLSALEWDELLDFKEQIQQSNIPILVQVFDWKKLPKSFHDNILANYEVIFPISIY